METAVLAHHGILGMKWGVRRYQNEDGTLTEAGKKRYERDIRENNAKKKDNRIKDLEETGPDPKRWAREDTERSKRIADAGGTMVKELKRIEMETRPKIDLANMSDAELRNKINRALLEQQYSKLYAETSPKQVSKGREALKNVLDVSGNVLAVAGSALGIALTIKQLTGE